MGAFGSAKASINFLTNNHLPSTEINNVQFNPSYVNSYPHEVDYGQREPSPDYLKGKIMLRTICLIVLLCSSTIMQAHNDNDSLAHRAFWWSENGNPILDGNGQCIRNGSWESLGKPKCLADATDAEPEVAAEVSPTQTTETKEAVVAEEVIAAPEVQVAAVTPAPAPAPAPATPSPTTSGVAISGAAAAAACATGAGAAPHRHATRLAPGLATNAPNRRRGGG